MAKALEAKINEDTIIELPVFYDGQLDAGIKAYNIRHTDSEFDKPKTNKNLIYLAFDNSITIEIFQKTPITVKGQTVNYETSQMIKTDGFSLFKLHPGTKFRIFAETGISYDAYEILNTPKKYSDKDNHAVDFVSTGKDQYQVERLERLIQIAGGGLVYSQNSGFSAPPTWLAKEFNGSPEFGFALSPFDKASAEKRNTAEVMHQHLSLDAKLENEELHKVGLTEVYRGKGPGVGRLFVADENGAEVYKSRDGKEYKGKIIEITDGKMAIITPNTPHRLLFDKSDLPFTCYVLNFAHCPLNLLPKNERDELEPKAK